MTKDIDWTFDRYKQLRSQGRLISHLEKGREGPDNEVVIKAGYRKMSNDYLWAFSVFSGALCLSHAISFFFSFFFGVINLLASPKMMLIMSHDSAPFPLDLSIV